MIINSLRKFKYFLVSLVVFISACSKDLTNMSIEEQAIHQHKRLSIDHSQDEYRHPLDILKFIGITEGNRVLDLLGGGGYYTELFNYIVGESGKVYIQNNSLFLSFSGEELEKRLKNNRLKHVERIDSEFSDMKLPADVDIIFIGLSYHDIYVPRENPDIMTTKDEFLSQVSKSLKPGGRLIIIDHAARPGTGIKTTPKLHRIDEVRVKNDLAEFGLTYESAIDILRNPEDNYDLDIWKKPVFRKTDRFVHSYIKTK